jgi:uncharacterized membrane protein YjdF
VLNVLWTRGPFQYINCKLNSALDMSRNVFCLLSQYVGAFYLYGYCVFLGLPCL